MKRLTLLILSMSITSGCFYQRADTFDIKQAIEHCGGADQVIYIEVWWLGSENVKCLDGTKKRWH